MIIPGDIIKIDVDVEDVGIITHDLVVSLIENDKIITCGHCLPVNSKLSFGKIIYTSGFDNEEEAKEIGIIKLYPELVSKFENKIDDKYVHKLKRVLDGNNIVFNYFNRNLKFGNIFHYTNYNLKSGFNFINGWVIDNQITKLNMPYYIVSGTDISNDSIIYNSAKKIFKKYKFLEEKFYFRKIYKMTSHGFSGSPWIVDIGNKLYHLGIHIGKVLGIKVRDNLVIEICEFAYVKPI